MRMQEFLIISIVGMVLFYILRILFNQTEFNLMALMCAVFTLAIALTDTELGDNLLYVVIGSFYIIATCSINMFTVANKRGS